MVLVFGDEAAAYRDRSLSREATEAGAVVPAQEGGGSAGGRPTRKEKSENVQGSDESKRGCTCSHVVGFLSCHGTLPDSAPLSS